MTTHMNRRRAARRLAMPGTGLLGLAGCHRAAPMTDQPRRAAKTAGGGGEPAGGTGAEAGHTSARRPNPSTTPRKSPATVWSSRTTASPPRSRNSRRRRPPQQQSRAVAARAQRLAGTPGAMAADAVENATRQVASDNAALELAQRRLSTVIGEGIPWRHHAATPLLQDLASGKAQAAARLLSPGRDAGRRTAQTARRPPGYGAQPAAVLERASAVERAGGPEPAGSQFLWRTQDE